MEEWGKVSNLISFANNPLCIFRPIKVASSLEAEIEAILFAIRLLQGRFLLNAQVVICSDSKEAIEQVYAGLPHHTSISSTFKGVFILPFYSFPLHFVPRELNTDADLLAKRGLSYKEIAIT